jgi:DNA gyrase/topoisomerase IV subunit A
VNGSKGIATGFSTTVLPHRMRDVTDAIRAIMDGRPVPELTPHWAGFKGTVEKAGNAWITTV